MLQRILTYCILLLAWPIAQGEEIVYFNNADPTSQTLLRKLTRLQQNQLSLVSRSSHFQRMLRAGKFSYVIAPPGIHHLPGCALVGDLLREASNNGGDHYIIVGFADGPDIEEVDSVTIGVLDEYGRKGSSEFFAKLFPDLSIKRIRRTPEARELSTMLGLELAEYIIVRESLYAAVSKGITADIKVLGRSKTLPYARLFKNSTRSALGEEQLWAILRGLNFTGVSVASKREGSE